MAADAGVVLVLLVHHRHGVPADERFDATLELAIAGVGDLVVVGDGVEVGRGDVAGGGHAGLAGAGAEGGKDGGALFPVVGDDLVEGLDPLCDLCGQVLSYCLVYLGHHRSILSSHVILTINVVPRLCQ